MGRLQQFIFELKRRRVIRVMVGWGVFSFAVLQIYEPVMHGLHLPEWTLSVVVLGLAAGFPATILLAWVFDIKAAGIERTRPAVEENQGSSTSSPPRKAGNSDALQVFTQARYLPTGDFDPSFGSAGIVQTFIDPPFVAEAYTSALALRPDGNIVAGGWSFFISGGTGRFVLTLARYSGS